VRFVGGEWDVDPSFGLSGSPAVRFAGGLARTICPYDFTVQQIVRASRSLLETETSTELRPSSASARSPQGTPILR
jgi:hypothetical protein